MIKLGINDPKVSEVRIKVLSKAHPIISSARASNSLSIDPGFELKKESNGDFILKRIKH